MERAIGIEPTTFSEHRIAGARPAEAEPKGPSALPSAAAPTIDAGVRSERGKIWG
jgi:hypothetical protein